MCGTMAMHPLRHAIWSCTKLTPMLDEVDMTLSNGSILYNGQTISLRLVSWQTPCLGMRNDKSPHSARTCAHKLWPAAG